MYSNRSAHMVWLVEYGRFIGNKILNLITTDKIILETNFFSLFQNHQFLKVNKLNKTNKKKHRLPHHVIVIFHPHHSIEKKINEKCKIKTNKFNSLSV